MLRMRYNIIMDIYEYFSSLGLPCGIIPYSACKPNKTYLIEKAKIAPVSVIMILAPYRTAEFKERNVSLYAVPRNYHLYFRQLFDDVIPKLESEFPGYRFAGFADHSPIFEREAAASAGLGIIGDNGMLIHEKYGSYVFIGEIVTDLPVECEAREIRHCGHCGTCTDACPSKGRCLSEITQKKGVLTEEELELIRNSGVFWGCDICQSVCPMNRNTEYSGIPFFSENTIPVVSKERIEAMSAEEFSERAYSWRGKKIISRNLDLSEQ